jgi:hypothetical protein
VLLRDVGVASNHPVLHLDRAAYGFERAGELGQDPVTRRLDDPPLMLGNLGVDQLAPMGLEPLQRALFIGADQT